MKKRKIEDYKKIKANSDFISTRISPWCLKFVRKNNLNVRKIIEKTCLELGAKKQ